MTTATGTRSKYANPSSECDVVMKGGITSAVIYPLAVCKIAEDRHLRNIGGASAGAIAAGIAAAAEYARETFGFERLEELPNKAGENLDLLFQPTDRTRPAMQVLLAALPPPAGKVRRALRVLAALIRGRLAAFLAAFLVVGGITFLTAVTSLGLPLESGDWPRLLWAWAPSAILIALPIALLATVVALVRLILKETPFNYFGITNGSTSQPKQGPGLTPWLHDRIQEVAGLGDEILTFGHLWGPSAVAAWEGDDNEDEEDDEPDPAAAAERARLERRHINLEMMTTNLTEGMPYRMPFEGRRFAFCPACFEDLFPTPVVERMTGSSVEVDPGDDGRTTCLTHETSRLRHLPPAPEFPVLVAVRMSLSFPVLISAVPLYKRDFNRKKGNHNWVRHWFSDGGIGSNFPIHFFDSLWPSRPTFGIDLEDTHPDFPESQFYLRKQSSRAQPRTWPIASLVGFLGQIISTMQNWRDRSLSMTPGYASRIVQILQNEEEGGINLRMPAPVIDTLSKRGAAAAAEFDRFDMDYHRWLRYRIAMSELDVVLTGLSRRYASTPPQAADYREFIKRFPERMKDEDKKIPYEPTGPEFPVTGADWREADQDNTKDLIEVANKWVSKGNIARHRSPSPSPILRFDSRQVERRK